MGIQLYSKLQFLRYSKINKTECTTFYSAYY